jgi:hypothetical protein
MKSQDPKLQSARDLLKAHGLLDSRGRYRPPTRTSADAQRRLRQIEEDIAAPERRRDHLAALEAEMAAAPPRANSSVGWRRDPQGRLRPVCWETGPVVTTGRPAGRRL